MEDVSSEKEMHVPCRMDYYVDRNTRADFMDIADQCTKGILVLWDAYCFDMNSYQGNIFQYQFDGSDVIVKKEYLFAMDYLTYVLTAYKETGKEVYKNTFERIISQFHEYLETDEPVYEELPIYGQTLLFIKAIDVLGDIPYQEDFLRLLRKYASWLMDDNNYFFDNNHGLFEDLALLHISILFGGGYPESVLWKEHTIKRINGLFKFAYYNDFTNNENSIMYFYYNNILYEQVVEFCRYYNIAGIERIENELEKSKKALITFAHKDCSFPLIGDGRVFSSIESNDNSCLFPDIGIAVLKVREVYLSFKCKTVYQAHAHIDISSVTARYKNIDFIIDSGQYNYDRYTPTNRYMRSSAGHSGIFPVFVDGLFQKEFCDSLQYSGITSYECGDASAFVKGEYQFDGVCVYRSVFVSSNEITIKDNWHCKNPVTMRQRFVIPKELIEKSKFRASRRILESEDENIKFQFEITSSLPDILTVVQFGIAAPQYNAYEETMLLDTFAENALSGEITAKITFREKE